MCLCKPWSVSSILCLPTLWSVSLSVSLPTLWSVSLSVSLPTLWSVSPSVPLSTYPVVCLCPSLDLPTLWSVSVRPSVYLPCGLSPSVPLSTYPWSVSVRPFGLSLRPPSVYLPCGLSLSVPRSAYLVVCLRPSHCLPTLWSISLSVALSTYPVVCLRPSHCLPTLWSLSLCPSLCLPTLRGGQKVQIQELPACRLSGFRTLPWSVPACPSVWFGHFLAAVQVADLRRRYVSACPTEAGLHVAACVPWRACRLSLHTLHQKQAF